MNDFLKKIKHLPMTFKHMPPSKFIMGAKKELYESWDDDIMSCSFEFEASVSQQYWITEERISKLLLTIPEFSHFESYISNDGFLQPTWLNALNIISVLNKKYIHLLPNNYFFSLPTELHWENAFYKNIYNNKIITNLWEWVFDPLCSFPEDKYTDWHGGITEKEEGVFSENGIIRVARIYKKSEPEMRIAQSYASNNAFRICIRPITNYDINDIFLKSINYNLIPPPVARL